MFTPPLNTNLNRLSQRTSVRWAPTLSVAASQAIQCVATHSVLRWMCVSGAAGAVNGLREAVLTEQQQWHQLSGALQHPAPGKQPDPVRILYSKWQKKKNYTRLSKSLDTVLSSTGLVCCPSACQMCANPNRPPECPHIRRWVLLLVSGVLPFTCWQNTTYLPFHCPFDFTLMLSVAFPAVLSLKIPGKFIFVFVSAVCVSVCVLKCDPCDSNRWRLFSEVDWN